MLAAGSSQQRNDCVFLMWFQDVHSLSLPFGRDGNVLLVFWPLRVLLAYLDCKITPYQVEEFEVATTGGVWVAAGGIMEIHPS